MTTTQTSVQFNPEIPPRTKLGSNAIPMELNQLSVSQLLGRDYLLIDDSRTRLPLNDVDAMRNLFEALIKQLELSETQTLAITFQQSPAGDIAFTRHDLSWIDNTVCSVQSTFIADPEQQAFMSMLWQSSVPANLVTE